MPRVPAAEPRFENDSERDVWKALCAQLGPDDLLLANVRVTSRRQDHEVDMVVGLHGHGVVAIEVKGKGIAYQDDEWVIGRRGHQRRTDPVAQAREGMYAVRDSLYAFSRWGDRQRIRFGHAVVFPYDTFSDEFALPDCPRWRVTDRLQLDHLVDRLRHVLDQQDVTHRAADHDDLDTLEDWRYGRMPLQRDLVAQAADREADADRLTQDQAVLLDAIRLLDRAEIRGGAGSGKTWLALEQARRLAHRGSRVALLCYSRGLATFLQRRTEGWSRKDTPAYVGTFHGLGDSWGAEVRTDNDTDLDYWERDLPAQMVALAAALPEGQKFDAVVVDEVQDFADAWWEALLASLKDPADGRIYVFADDGQRVFPRFADTPIGMPTLLLDQNLRNTRQIAESFQPLGATRMRAVGGDGPEVMFVACSADQAVSEADDAVERLLDDGWRPEDVALLTTGPRHPVQLEQVAINGQSGYWACYWDKDQVFYGHVLGFQGLERRAVVLALNEAGGRDRSKERLYVGMSRATDLLVVCGDPDYVREVAGEATLRRLQGPAA
ncbi:MAG TPA: ATP-binding domain-containing protein [Nocardioidaceae bacterium]|nr:ATP-binding domain-containing protein [Nocardioidaceae bacterium]